MNSRISFPSMVRRSGRNCRPPAPHLKHGGVDNANVLIFAVAYWRTDRGGPEARANHASTKPDLAFPQVGAPKDRACRNSEDDLCALLFCDRTLRIIETVEIVSCVSSRVVRWAEVVL